MPIKITVNLFSGIRNPSFVLRDADAKAFFDKLSLSRFKKATKDSKPFPSVLGYRGITVEQQGKRISNDLPLVMHLTHDAAFVEGMVAEGKLAFSSIILDNLGNIKGLEDTKAIRKKIEKGIEHFTNKRELYIRNYYKYFEKTLLEFYNPIRFKACSCAPVPDLDNWNAPSVVGGNNCYNYSTNYRTDTFAQPGEASLHPYTSMASCNPVGETSVKAGAISDGLIELPTNNNRCPSTGHLVALVIDPIPSRDYHWYRKGCNGKWSHKPGGTPATVLDDSGLPITDPRTADRGDYSDFCTFMQVIQGHFKIK